MPLTPALFRSVEVALASLRDELNAKVAGSDPVFQPFVNEFIDILDDAIACADDLVTWEDFNATSSPGSASPDGALPSSAASPSQAQKPTSPGASPPAALDTPADEEDVWSDAEDDSGGEDSAPALEALATLASRYGVRSGKARA